MSSRPYSLISRVHDPFTIVFRRNVSLHGDGFAFAFFLESSGQSYQRGRQVTVDADYRAAIGGHEDGCCSGVADAVLECAGTGDYGDVALKAS